MQKHAKYRQQTTRERRQCAWTRLLDGIPHRFPSDVVSLHTKRNHIPAREKPHLHTKRRCIVPQKRCIVPKKMLHEMLGAGEWGLSFARGTDDPERTESGTTPPSPRNGSKHVEPEF